MNDTTYKHLYNFTIGCVNILYEKADLQQISKINKTAIPLYSKFSSAR